MTIHHHKRDSVGRLLTMGLLFSAFASLTACNTTKATADTIVKFTASTSPDSMFSRDGLVAKEQQVLFYTAVVRDHLQEEIARGHGEYLSSLGVLLDVPEDRQATFSQASQGQYAALFPSAITDDREGLAILRQQLMVRRSEALR